MQAEIATTTQSRPLWDLLIGLLLVSTASVGFAAESGRLAGVSDVSPQMLVNPPVEDWLIWRRTYDSAGFSPLQEISRQNVDSLQLAFSKDLESGPNIPTPLVHDGVMYLLSTRDTLLAMDAASGETLWSYQHQSDAVASAKIGIALSGNKVLVPTSDMHMVALDSSSGEVIWSSEIETPSRGSRPYALRGAPLVANGVVVQGITATMVPEGGFIVGLDLNSGAELWRFHSVARPDTAGGDTWSDLPLQDRSGGSVWMPGSYSPELDLVYFGLAPTYDTAALLAALDLNGSGDDALYTNSTVALRPATGELVWYYQHMPNDQWDLDWVYERHLMDIEVNGRMRRVVLTAGKMALYDALDAATGDYLFSIDMGLQNIVTAIDAVTGAKTISANAIPNAEESHLLCPFANGGRNWQSAAFDAASRVLVLPIAEICMNAGPTGQGGILSSGAALNPAPGPNSNGFYGRWQAVNVQTRELLWSHREIVPPTSAALATAGGVVFIGALDESFKALDIGTGEVLWETDLGDIPTSFPITYSVDGKQYVAVAIGTPTINANVWIGTVNAFLGGGENVASTLSREGAALKVFSLQ